MSEEEIKEKYGYLKAANKKRLRLVNGVYSQSKGYKWRYGGDANANF